MGGREGEGCVYLAYSLLPVDHIPAPRRRCCQAWLLVSQVVERASPLARPLARPGIISTIKRCWPLRRAPAIR